MPRTAKARFRYVDKLSLNIYDCMFWFSLYTYLLSSILLAVFFFKSLWNGMQVIDGVTSTGFCGNYWNLGLRHVTRSSETLKTTSRVIFGLRGNLIHSNGPSPPSISPPRQCWRNCNAHVHCLSHARDNRETQTRRNPRLCRQF